MEEKYTTYSLEGLAEDKQFIQWAIKGQESPEWEKYLNAHPEFREKANKAREILLLLHDTCDVLDEESVHSMWQNIDHYSKLYEQKTRRLKIRKAVSWAASVLLILSLGIFGYLKWGVSERTYQFASAKATGTNNEARLILSGGEEVALKKDNSTVSLNNENQLIINNDSIIDLSEKEAEEGDIEMYEVVVPYGKKSELQLADGTKVWLNAGSRLAFPSKFTKNTREVFLEGEACFKVAHNKSRPFVVNAGQLDVKVLGTYFDITAYPTDERIETILIEGSVAVSKPATFGIGQNEVILKPNEKASFDKQSNEVSVASEPDAVFYIAWTSGWLQFSKESLQSVFSKLERYYNIEVKIPQNFPSEELITGKLDLKDSLEEVMYALADVAKIEFRLNGNSVYVERKMKKIDIK